MVPPFIRCSVQILEVILNYFFFSQAHPICHENHVSSAWGIYPEWAINSPTNIANVIQAVTTLPGDYYNSPVLFPCFHPSLPLVSIQQSNQSNLLRCKSDFCQSLFQSCNVLPSSSKYNPNLEYKVLCNLSPSYMSDLIPFSLLSLWV